MSDAKITIRENGPYRVEGDVPLFDHVGNRVEMITDSDDSDKDRTVAYTYDMNDRLLTEASDADTGDDTFTVYSYGNATGTSGGDATQQTGKKVWDGLDDTGSVIEAVTYDYNLQGRMAKATITKGGDTTELEYAYDDSGIRVGQTETVNSGTPVVHEYLVDANNPTGYQQVLEEFIDSVLAKSYTLGLDVIAQANTGSPVDDYFFLYDAHGSTRALLDAAAAVVQTYAYDAYGNALGFDTAAALTNLLYSGEQFDQKLAMQYLRARYYDAATGRFNRVDPFAGDPAVPHSLHKYLYGHANPLFHIDPTGHLSVVSILKVAAALIFLNHIHLQVVPRLSRIRYWLAPTVTRNNFSVLDYQMALLSREAYRLEPRNVHSWTVVGDPALSTLGLEPAAFFDNETGFSAVLYRHMIRHDYVLSFRGTEDGRDWDDNFMQALSGFAPQYDQAVSLAQKVHNEVTKRGGKLIFTGHSLGGGLATMAAYATGDRAITFNAAGVGLFGKTGALGHPPLSSPDIVAYFVQGEVLTEAQIVLGLFAPDTAGSLRRLYPALEDRDMSSLDLHGIDTVIRAMDGI
ncbi:MAG: RHS repeat-associated core domain-containing protein [Phycisphaeraceae bacterium]